MNTLWKLLNYLIIILILGVAGYFVIFTHPGRVTGEGEDQLIRDVRQNAQYPKLVAWLFGKKDPNSQTQTIPDTSQPGTNDNNANPQDVSQNSPMDSQVDPNNADPFPDPASPADTGMFVAAPAQAPPGANVMEKVLQEGHWIGLEVGPLTPALATANGIPTNIKGVLVDEVTLLAASSGLLAGDVIIAINNIETGDLYSFKVATRPIAMSKQAMVTVYRAGAYSKVAVRGGGARN